MEDAAESVTSGKLSIVPDQFKVNWFVHHSELNLLADAHLLSS